VHIQASVLLVSALRTDNGPTEDLNQQWRNALLRSDPDIRFRKTSAPLDLVNELSHVEGMLNVEVHREE
jgi:hypothetical protein